MSPAETLSPTTVLHFENALLQAGWAKDVRVELSGSTIAKVASGSSGGDAAHRYAVGIPGMANLHSHAFQRGFAGLAERRTAAGQDSFWTWREIMYRFVEHITPDELESIAAQAYVEMLESGFTHVGEFHYLHHAANGREYENLAEGAQRIAAAAELTGIGLTLLPVFYAHADFGGAPPKPLQRRFITGLDQYARLLEASLVAIGGLPGAQVGVAPHSLRAVNPAELSAVVDLAAGRPVHIHIAEQQKEVEDCLLWSGARPVQWLLDNAPVDERWCLVHATHIGVTERQAVIASGCTAGLCPITEANLGDGLFPASQFLSEGGNFGVGSDSNVLISLAEELRLLEYGQRLRLEARNTLGGEGASTGRRLFDAAAAGGARALGVRSGLRAGEPADIVTLSRDAVSIMEKEGDAILDGWIFASATPIVQDVWRGGCRVVAEGRHRYRRPIASRYRTSVSRLCSA